MRFVRGVDGGVVMPLFCASICGVFINVLGGEAWWLIWEVGAIGTSRKFTSACLPPCSLRMSDALCGMGEIWMVPSVLWTVVRIRGMSILLLVWLALWGLVGGGNKREFVLDSVRIV